MTSLSNNTMPYNTRSETHSDGEEWDDCDLPLSSSQPEHKPTTKQIHLFQAINGVKSGLVHSSSLPADIDPHRIPSDVAWQKQMLQDKVLTWQWQRKTLELFGTEQVEALPPSLIIASKNRLTYAEVERYQHELVSSGNSKLPFFFYGATMFPSIVRGTSGMSKTLLEVARSMTPATVVGYERRALRGSAYPTAARTQNANSSITGMLVFGIPNASRMKIDAFQSNSSEMRRVQAIFQTNNGGRFEINCGIYAQKNDECPNPLSLETQVWDMNILMESAWHLKNLAPLESEEREIEKQELAPSED